MKQSQFSTGELNVHGAQLDAESFEKKIWKLQLQKN